MKNWRDWGKREFFSASAIAAALAGYFAMIGDARQAYSTLDPVLPATHGYVADRIANASNSLTPQIAALQTMLRDTGADLARVRIDELRTGTGQLQGQLLQLGTLLEKDPSNQFLRGWMAQIQEDIDTNNLSLKAATCDLGKRTIVGFTCSP